MSEEHANGQPEELPVAEPLVEVPAAEPQGAEQSQPPENRDPYEFTNKKGKDPWKPSLLKEICSWCFWLFMLYLCTAGFIYGYLTQGEDGEEVVESDLADTIFIPAEMVRNYSYTYQRMSDWQISCFRPKEDDENGMPPGTL
ncbi:MAG: hypothetical protein ACPGVU_16210 [Limisphaerales bacterium]